MRVAQGLYERGFITYMRTDSTTLSESAIAAARSQAAELYGADHVSPAPRQYERKVKNAQEAHEAIRPAGDTFRTPAQVAGQLVGDDFALYDLIWKRTVASQMADAKVATTTIKLGATARDGRRAEFSASGTVITFAGFLAAYEESSDDDPESGDGAKKEVRLPSLAEGDSATLISLSVDEHATKPPARFTEASLVKQLEERGIGRPSTYAATMGVLVDRGYVNKKGSALVPTWLAFAVVRLLEEHFSSLVDYDFTATMEEVLDEIANGDNARLEVLSNFYRGGDGLAGHDFPGVKKLAEGLGDIDAREISAFPIKDSDIILRVGRYGPYLDRNGERANLPEDLAPDELTAAVAEELMAAPSGDRELGTDPATGHTIIAKSGRYGPYVTEVLPEDETPANEDAKPKKRAKAKVKPRTASLFKDMSLDTVTLDDALRLLSLPRTVGQHPEDGADILARNGPYGPYVSWNKETRSLPDEPSLFTVDVAQAVQLLAQPKQRGRAAANPGKEVGTDPNTEKTIMLKDGRFGPYVTDGETNASLRRADDPESLTLERAVELLAERRAAGPPKKRAKKAAKKTAKKTTKKPAAKKAAAKKAATT